MFISGDNYVMLLESKSVFLILSVLSVLVQNRFISNLSDWLARLYSPGLASKTTSMARIGSTPGTLTSQAGTLYNWVCESTSYTVVNSTLQ